MGKLDDIIDRNKNPKRFGERMTVGIGLGVFILFILFAMVCTNMGKRPEADAPPRPDMERPGPAPGRGIDPTDKRVNDVRFGTPRPPAGSAAAPQGVRP